MAFLKTFLNTFIPLFVAIDVFLLIPVYISLTEGIPAEQRKRVITQSTITALAVSLAFVAVGKAIFGILGIRVEDFQVAGGLVLLVLAVLDLAGYERRRPRSHETVGVVPIGVPLIVGPAVLTTLLVLIDRHGLAPTVLSLILNLLFVWLALRGARRVAKALGTTGIAALSKIMALLLAAIAVMMIRLGIEGTLRR